VAASFRAKSRLSAAGGNDYLIGAVSAVGFLAMWQLVSIAWFGVGDLTLVIPLSDRHRGFPHATR
jgi:hypothetical protein